jgi:8-oxo-dGTP diphosphatase
LPGGAIQQWEGLDEAAMRLLAERTGVTGVFLEQLYTFGEPLRDPRGRTVSVAYYALLPRGPIDVRAGRETDAASWMPLSALPPLAFDHARIVEYGRLRLEQKITDTPLAFRALPARFTIRDLRCVYEAIFGRSLDPGNFQRQMLARRVLKPVSGVVDRRTPRPAQVYRYVGPLEILGKPSEGPQNGRGKKARRGARSR